MGNPYEDRSAIREGEWRLRDMLPEARKLSAAAPAPCELSGLAEAMAPYIYEANFRALVVAPGDKGGWVADLLLRDVPPGVSNCLGTPVSTPYETRYEAIQAAKALLVNALVIEREVATGALAGDKKPTFWLHSTVVDLDAKLLERMAPLAPASRREEVVAVLTESLEAVGLLHSCIPDDFDAAVADKDRRVRLLGALHAAAIGGVLVFPPRTVAGVG